MEFNYKQQPGLKLTKELNCVDPQMALVTIVTPYYNAGKYFEQTFNSVMNQTFPWFEWIIINDGTTKESDIAVLNRFAKKDRRIQLINQENKGLACARNVGIENAKTDIVIPLDADDVIVPQYVECLYFGLFYNPKAAWCYSNSIGFDAQEYMWNHTWNAQELKTYNFLNYSAAIRKKDAMDIGGYKVEKWSYYEDWRFWLDMLGAHKKPVRLGDYLFWYRRLENGMLSTIRRDPERVEFCEHIINEAAEKVNETIEAIEYPLKQTEHPYYKPKKFVLGEKYKIKKESFKIRILMIIPWMVMGGADKFNLDLVSGLNKDKFEISIITTVPSQNNWQQKFEVYTDEIFNLPNFLDPAHYAEFVSYYIDSRDIDILFVSNSTRGYYMVPWLRKEFPKIHIIDYVHMEEWYWKAGGHARESGVLGAFLDKTYVCNNATRNVMIKNFGRNADSIKTLYIGVDQEEFNPQNVRNGYLHSKLNIPDEQPIILFPCRIHPQKRPFMVLDIAERVRERNNTVVFVIVGDGEQLQELRDEINSRELDDVVVSIGRSDHMKECYADAKLTLICSLKEGLSLTAYESCSMGVPVISSDVGGQGDLIDSSVGKLIPMRQTENVDLDNRKFDQEEVCEYTDAIIELLSDPELYNRCSKNCRQKIESDFSINKMIEGMSEELEKIVFRDELKEQHIEMCTKLESFDDLADEMYTLSLALEERECACEIVWQERVRFQNDWSNVQELLHKSERAEAELTSIKGMRLYKLIEIYIAFINENKLGKRIYKVLKKIFGKKSLN